MGYCSFVILRTMASSGSALLFVLLQLSFLQTQATGVYTFEAYSDGSCSAGALTKTEYLEEASTGCYVYTDVNGLVDSGASSFTLTCSAGFGEYTEYVGANCGGSAVSSVTKPWFTTVMCASQAAAGHTSSFTSFGSSSCTKSYLPV